MKDKFTNALFALESDFALGLLIPKHYDDFDMEAFNRDIELFSEFVWNIRTGNYTITEKSINVSHVNTCYICNRILNNGVCYHCLLHPKVTC